MCLRRDRTIKQLPAPAVLQCAAFGLQHHMWTPSTLLLDISQGDNWKIASACKSLVHQHLSISPHHSPLRHANEPSRPQFYWEPPRAPLITQHHLPSPFTLLEEYSCSQGAALHLGCSYHSIQHIRLTQRHDAWKDTSAARLPFYQLRYAALMLVLIGEWRQVQRTKEAKRRSQKRCLLFLTVKLSVVPIRNGARINTTMLEYLETDFEYADRAYEQIVRSAFPTRIGSRVRGTTRVP